MVHSRTTVISSLHELYIELLEAAGVLDDRALAVAGVDELVEELERANNMLRIVEEIPSPAVVADWIEAAAARTGIEAMPEREVEMPVNYEANADVGEMLKTAPLAIPLPGRLLVENKLAVADIPVGVLLTKYSGNLDVRIASNESERPATSWQRSAHHIQKAEFTNAQVSRLEVDTSRMKPTHHFSNVGIVKLPVFSTEADGEHAILRAPLEQTNRGRDPRSRRFIRGVLHSHPGRIYSGAVITLALIGAVPLGITAAVLLMMSQQHLGNFQWVKSWFLAFPVAVFVLGLLFCLFSYPCRCRICTHRLFVPQRFLKNSKAHHVPGLGYIIPLCFQLLTFHWFRCTHCGTPVRLKR